MNRKNASRVIGRKIALWKKTLPENLQEAVEGNVIVTGGCIASLLLGEEVNDFDLYLRDKQTAKLLAHYYAELFKARGVQKGHDIPINVLDKDGRIYIHIKSAGIVGVGATATEYAYFEGDPDEGRAEDYVAAATQGAAAAEKDKKEENSFEPVWMSCNAISLAGRLQIVVRFYGEPDKIHSTYDFEHCMNYWQDKEGELRLVLRPPALEALLARELRYAGSLYPVCSLFRIRKFIERGWSINAGQILKIAWQVSALNLQDPNVLEDQLVGVDAAYFHEVMSMLRKRVEDGKTIDDTYLARLIDKVF